MQEEMGIEYWKKKYLLTCLLEKLRVVARCFFNLAKSCDILTYMALDYSTKFKITKLSGFFNSE